MNDSRPPASSTPHFTSSSRSKPALRISAAISSTGIRSRSIVSCTGRPRSTISTGRPSMISSTRRKRYATSDVRKTSDSSVVTATTPFVSEWSSRVSACETSSGIRISITSSIGVSWLTSRLPTTRSTARIRT